MGGIKSWAKNDYVFYRTKNGHIARFNPNKPWEAMDRKGKVIKKTKEIPKNEYSDEEPEYEEGYKRDDLQMNRIQIFKKIIRRLERNDIKDDGGYVIVKKKNKLIICRA